MEQFKKLYKPLLKPVRPGLIIKGNNSIKKSIQMDFNNLNCNTKDQVIIKDSEVAIEDSKSEGILVEDDLIDLDISISESPSQLNHPIVSNEEESIVDQSAPIIENNNNNDTDDQETKNILDQMLLECREQVLSCQHKMDQLERDIPDSLSLLTDQLNQLHNLKLELMLETM